MKFQIALLALVALGTCATAAQITAGPFILQTEPAPPIAYTILSQLADPGLSAYDYLVIAAPAVVIPTPDAPLQIPIAALAASAALAVSFCTILGWQRRAVRQSHRVFSRRRKRTLRKMADI